MKAVRPVLNNPEATGEKIEQIDMGRDQDEFVTLPTDAVERRVAATQTHEGAAYFVSISRWRPTDEERAQIAAGADIVHQVIHIPGRYPPMNLQVVFPTDDPQIVNKLEG